MKEIQIEEIKNIQLDILDKVHLFCERNKIEYSLAYGTLLGAVRHKGYIPWDDDIDICMTRSNYNKFISKFNGEYSDLSVLSPELNWDYYAPYANVYNNQTILKEGDNGHRGIEIGVKIDIFPIDEVPNSLYGYDFLRVIVLLYNRCLQAKRWNLQSAFSENKKLWLVLVFYRILAICLSYSSIQRIIHRLAVNNHQTSFVDNIVFPVRRRTRCSKSLYSSYLSMEFEGRFYKVMSGYRDFLSNRYGDYLTLPPIEKRVMHHNFQAFWK